LKGAWFLSQSRKFFSYAALLFLKFFSAAQQNIFLQKKILFQISVGVMTVGVLSVGVMTVGVISVGVMTVGVLSVGVMALSPNKMFSATEIIKMFEFLIDNIFGHGFYPGVGSFFRMQRYCF
jgi:hypothetical protein